MVEAKIKKVEISGDHAAKVTTLRYASPDILSLPTYTT